MDDLNLFSKIIVTILLFAGIISIPMIATGIIWLVSFASFDYIAVMQSEEAKFFNILFLVIAAVACVVIHFDD